MQVTGAEELERQSRTLRPHRGASAVAKARAKQKRVTQKTQAAEGAGLRPIEVVRQRLEAVEQRLGKLGLRHDNLGYRATALAGDVGALDTSMSILRLLSQDTGKALAPMQTLAASAS